MRRSRCPSALTSSQTKLTVIARRFFIFSALALIACTGLKGQSSFSINLGANYAIALSGIAPTQKPKTGMLLGLDYWGKNRKGNDWTLGLNYQTHRQVGKKSSDRLKEKYDYAQLRFSPMVWWFKGSKKAYASAGVFVSYLAQQETQAGTNFMDKRAIIKKTVGGLTAGIGYKMGREGDKNCLHIGLRNDYGILAFGKESLDLRFNVISAFVGLGF
jgi:hypothetical protein